MRLSKLSTKLYYKVANQLLTSKSLTLPENLAPKRCIFLYFDYEREFGGHKTSITDKDIKELLSVLDKYQFKTTWFAVGKIFKQYPLSIESILRHGNEIGCHTYNHIPPLKTSNKELQKDIDLFKRASGDLSAIKGFHSPNGLWSVGYLKLLEEYGFVYDVVGTGKKAKPDPLSIRLREGKELIRLHTVGDDYSLLNKRFTDIQISEYFQALLNRIQRGCISGIGFHPWVLFSDSNILKGFYHFIDYLSNQEDVIVKPAEYYVKAVKRKS